MVRLPFNVPYESGNERKYIDQVFLNGHFAGNGQFTKLVQEWLERFLGAERVLLTHSCTAALEMAAMLCEIGENDEFVVPSYTFVTSASSMMRSGGVPVFCEIDPETMLIDVHDAERKISDRTKAIIPVHYAGFSPNMDLLQEICKRKKIMLIEDAAQGFGSTWNGKKLGTFGSMGAISFHETKNIHCGLGGCLVINDPKLIEKAEIIWERGTNRSAFFRGEVDKYTWREIGSSFYPTELQAAFLLAQLESFEKNQSMREEIWNHYYGFFGSIELDYSLRILRPSIGTCQNFHMFAIILETSEEAEIVREGLNDEGINAVIHYVPLHESKIGEEYSDGKGLEITSDLSGRLLRLPFHQGISMEEIESASRKVREILSSR